MDFHRPWLKHGLVSEEGCCLLGTKNHIERIYAGLEFCQQIYLSDGQVDLQNHLSVMKSTCPTQENHKIKRLFNVAP